MEILRDIVFFFENDITPWIAIIALLAMWLIGMQNLSWFASGLIVGVIAFAGCK